MYSVLLSVVLSGAGTAPADTYGSYGSEGGGFGAFGARGYFQPSQVLPTLPYVDQNLYGHPLSDRKTVDKLPYNIPPLPKSPPSAPHSKNPWINEPQPRPPINTVKPPSSTIKSQGTGSKAPPSSVIKPQGTGSKSPSTTIKPQDSTVKPPSTAIKPQGTGMKPPSTTIMPQGTGSKLSAGTPSTGKPSVRYLDKTGQTDEPPLLIKGADRVPVVDAPRSPAKANTEKPAAPRTPEARKEEPAKDKEKVLAPTLLDKLKSPVDPPVRSRPIETPSRKDPFALDNKMDLPSVASLEGLEPEEKASAKGLGGSESASAKPAKADEVKGTLTLKEGKVDPDSVPANRARLVVTLPPNGKLYVNGHAVQAAVNPSSYLTPELRNDTKYFYTVHVEVPQNGALLVSEARQVFFQPGGEARVSFENVAVFMPSATPGSL